MFRSLFYDSTVYTPDYIGELPPTRHDPTNDYIHNMALLQSISWHTHSPLPSVPTIPVTLIFT